MIYIYILRYTEVTITQRGCDVRVEKQICLQSFCVLYSYSASLSLCHPGGLFDTVKSNLLEKMLWRGGNCNPCNAPTTNSLTSYAELLTSKTGVTEMML